MTDQRIVEALMEVLELAGDAEHAGLVDDPGPDGTNDLVAGIRLGIAMRSAQLTKATNPAAFTRLQGLDASTAIVAASQTDEQLRAALADVAVYAVAWLARVTERMK